MASWMAGVVSRGLRVRCLHSAGRRRRARCRFARVQRLRHTSPARPLGPLSLPRPSQRGRRAPGPPPMGAGRRSRDRVRLRRRCAAVAPGRTIPVRPPGPSSGGGSGRHGPPARHPGEGPDPPAGPAVGAGCSGHFRRAAPRRRSRLLESVRRHGRTHEAGPVGGSARSLDPGRTGGLDRPGGRFGGLRLGEALRRRKSLSDGHQPGRAPADSLRPAARGPGTVLPEDASSHPGPDGSPGTRGQPGGR